MNLRAANPHLLPSETPGRQGVIGVVHTSGLVNGCGSGEEPGTASWGEDSVVGIDVPGLPWSPASASDMAYVVGGIESMQRRAVW
jgi:hypothetical protein